MLLHRNRSTDTFVILCELLNEWRDDPDRLAVAAKAYELAGYTWPGWELRGMSDKEAGDRIRAALHRRNRKRLRHMAVGLLLALESLAPDVRARRLHDAQVEAAVIGCRPLSPDERIAALRAGP